LTTYWQALEGRDEETRLVGLRKVLPWLSYVHVQCRTPLVHSEDVWLARFGLVRTTGRDHAALIEFVRNDEPEALIECAATLQEMVGGEHER
jgi:hypothetical protein